MLYLLWRKTIIWLLNSVKLLTAVVCTVTVLSRTGIQKTFFKSWAKLFLSLKHPLVDVRNSGRCRKSVGKADWAWQKVVKKVIQHHMECIKYWCRVHMVKSMWTGEHYIHVWLLNMSFKTISINKLLQQPPSSSSTPNWEKHFFIAGLVHKGLPQTVATIGCTLRLLSKMELCFVELRKTAPDQRYVKVCLFVFWWQCCSVGWSLHLFGSDWIISLLLDGLPWNLVHTFMVLRGRRLLSLMIPWLVFLVDSHDIWFKYSSPPQDE